MNKTQTAVIQWLADRPHAESSSRAMAFYLGFGAMPKDGEDSYPRDINAFDHCLDLLSTVPGLRRKLPEMAALSKHWRKIVKAWDKLEATYVAEYNLQCWKRPPRGTTHKLIKALIKTKHPSSASE